MLAHLQLILTEFGVIPKSILPVVSAYLLSLMLVCRRHDARQAAHLTELHESAFSRLLHREDVLPLAKKCLNRAARRRLTVLPKLEKQGKTPLLLIDATLISRRGKKVGNRGAYNHGKGTVLGHKIINCVMLLENEVIPLSAIPHYTKQFCRENGITYKTEAKIVQEWIHWFPSSGLLAKEQMRHIHFVFDCGYDVKSIQKAVRRIGAHFTMSIKANRIVDGTQVREFFRRHRHLPWQAIRLKSGNGGKGSQRSYRLRHQERARLKGFGPVTLICSQVRRKGSGQLSRKFLVCSDPGRSRREIVETYRNRWAIETWHKEMKQNHGYRDCKSAHFRAVEAHLNFCLAGYCLLGERIHGFLKKGTTTEDYLAACKIQKMARTINLFGGKQRLKTHAQAVMQGIKVA
jgi:hypothetical protein